jgi:beta-lactamase regulating signal transducer with metallopeptidase domain
VSALVAAVWQGLAAAWTTALVLKSLPRTSAAGRHAVWWVALVAVLALALWPFVSQPGATTGLAGSEHARPMVLLTPPEWLVAGAVLVWLGWSICGAARVARGLAALRRLTRESTPIDEALQRQLHVWSSVRHAGRRSELRQSPGVSSACAVGLIGRPTILVSARLVDALEPGDLDLIVMHEHAHLARYDDWLRLLQSVVTVVAGLHPAVAYIGRHTDFEREAACDDRVVARAGSARQYARCLAEAADVAAARCGARDAHLLAPGAIARGGGVVARVARLVDRERVHGRRVTRLGAATCALTVASVTGLAVTSAPLVVVKRAEAAWPSVGGQLRHPIDQPQALRPIPATLSTVWAPVGPAVRAARPEPARPAPHVALADATSGADRPSLRGAESIERPADGRTLDSPSSGVLPSHASLEPSPLHSRVVWADESPGSAPFTSFDSTWRAVGDGGARIGRGVAHAGVTTGAGARSAGLAVAGFFTRAGQRVAGSF